jgi:hypothetical protein
MISSFAASDLFRIRSVNKGGRSFQGGVVVETGEFILARWALTFGVPLLFAAWQLWLLRSERLRPAAAAV